MALVNMREILLDAKLNNYAVGGFDCWNLESIRAVAEAAEESRSPAIILTGPYGLGSDHMGIEYFGKIARIAAEKSSVPIAILLNEANGFSLIIEAIRSGFTSVMLETSHLSFEDNIKITSNVVEIAHSVNVSVESQLGIMPLREEIPSLGKMASIFTNPEEAKNFVDITGIDALAISFGNVHLGESEEYLNFNLLNEVRNIINIPLVVHGGSGFPKKYIKDVINKGVNKFNIGYILRQKFLEGIEKSIIQKQEGDSIYSYVFIEKILEKAKNNMKKEVTSWINLLGSKGRV
ncbi:MAG: class II fructose-bisphosphate aldolase [Actinobacteria bacterium]|nr:class II fructose-bisphosphate aldolase [Actinomycetota bacterium]